MTKGFIKKLHKKIRSHISEPFYFYRYLKAILRGSLYILYYRLFKKNVKIGFPFKAYSFVKIVGPGSVSIGRNCSVLKSVFKGLSIATLSKEAEVSIGNNCLLGGLTIRCINYVEIGERTMTAISLVQDLLLINLNKDSFPHYDYTSATKPIIIGENVWLGRQCCILSGCKIGSDSVISAGSTCYNSQFKKYSIIIGSPAKRGLPIESIMKLKG